tara:strand:- start:9837 stop:10361 length:525 start_codon:yes stop_codon:yes gene_type:complete
MPHTITLSAAACRTAYKAFGQALNTEIANQMVAHFNAERGKIIGEAESCPKEIIDILNSSLEAILQKVGKQEKKPKKQTPKKAKKPQGIKKRFKYKGEDQKGENGAFLRISVNKETRIVSKVNEGNWTAKANKQYIRTFGTGDAYIIPAGAGKKAQIVATKPYKKSQKKQKTKK